MTEDELHQDDPLRRYAAALRAPVALVPGIEGRIVRRRRHQQRLRIGAVVVTMGAALVAIVIARPSPSHSSTRVFTFSAPLSHTVSLVGDFTDWQPDRIHLTENTAGTWTATVKLAPGRYRFAWVVDQHEWRADQNAAPAPDDFGRPTSVVTVTEP